MIPETVRKFQSQSLHQQGSQGWLEQRQGRITASEVAKTLLQSEVSVKSWMDAFGVTDFIPKPSVSCYQGHKVSDYVVSKSNPSTITLSNAFMVWGHKYEPAARRFIALLLNMPVYDDIGMISHPSISFLGASPDAVTQDLQLIEIKCPPCRPICNVVPLHYWMQVQMQLECMDLEKAIFLDCKFREYTLQSEWKDVAGDNNEHRYGLFLAPGHDTRFERLAYIYPPDDITTVEDLLAWSQSKRESAQDDGEILTVVYYHLEHYAALPVVRDRVWFQNNLAELQTTWDKVVYHRTPQGIAEIKQQQLEESARKRDSNKRKREDASSPKKERKTIKTPRFKECLLSYHEHNPVI